MVVGAVAIGSVEMVARLAGRSVGWLLVGRSFDWLVSWLVGWLASWPVGRSVG